MAALVFGEPSCELAGALLSDKAVHAPSLLPYEIANVARTKQRAGADAAGVDAALRDFADQRIALHAADPQVTKDLALRYDLSAYDAAYLWLAAELKAPLASFDQRLANAARRHLGTLE